jgi:cysteine synthase A
MIDSPTLRPIRRSAAEQIGQTDLLRLDSLSSLSGCEILLKCEYQNPGGSIKDRAALQMVTEAMQAGDLREGMTIVEGTAGNTGIGLSVVARSFGLHMLAVMPRGQTIEKQRMIELHGAELHLVDPCPFANPDHFYHTARRLAEQREDYWWANQFENLANTRAHLQHTGPEIWQQTGGRIDALVSVCGTGGTIAGNSAFLKSQSEDVRIWLIDPQGSGIVSYLRSGEYHATGSSMTEGIGIMRSVENFRQARIDHALTLPDQDLVCISRAVRDRDSLVLGSSSALNVAGALFVAAQAVRSGSPGKVIVTCACDVGERSFSKLYNPDYLAERNLDVDQPTVEALFDQYLNASDETIVNTSSH